MRSARLTNAQVIDIKTQAKLGIPYREIARQYRVSEDVVNNAANGVTYPHIAPELNSRRYAPRFSGFIREIGIGFLTKHCGKRLGVFPTRAEAEEAVAKANAARLAAE